MLKVEPFSESGCDHRSGQNTERLNVVTVECLRFVLAIFGAIYIYMCVCVCVCVCVCTRLSLQKPADASSEKYSITAFASTTH